MATNIFKNRANVCVAKQTISFVNAGINGENTEIIYRTNGDNRSYVPGRMINPITRFEQGISYYIIAKQDMDLTTYVYPPLPGDH